MQAYPLPPGTLDHRSQQGIDGIELDRRERRAARSRRLGAVSTQGPKNGFTYRQRTGYADGGGLIGGTHEPGNITRLVNI